MRAVLTHRLLLVLGLSACQAPPCGERVLGGGLLTVALTDTTPVDLGGEATLPGITEVGGQGASLVEPADVTEWVVVSGSMPAPAWSLFPAATDAVLEVELFLGREPERAEIIRVEWIDPTGPRRNLAVRDVPDLTWTDAASGSIVFANMAWESCSEGACEDVATGTTTVTWAFDAVPLSDTTEACQ